MPSAEEATFCPICGESLVQNASHVFKHFKYKKFPCAECDTQFYTDADRNTHCMSSGHKRSFQKTVQPYIEMLVEMITKDAFFLQFVDLDRIVAVRKDNIENGNEELENLEVENASSILVEKAPKSNGSEKKLEKEVDREDEEDMEDEEDERKGRLEHRPTTPSVSVTSKEDKESRRARKSSPGNSERAISNSRSSTGGWYDPNDPERQDLTLVKCCLCEKDISYDYLIRKEHVGNEHVNQSSAGPDFLKALKNQLKLAFPDLPNIDTACQLCMTGAHIRTEARREHIENHHFLSVPGLQCPLIDCFEEFRRQCDLGAHMKVQHDIFLSKHKDKEFQRERMRRNAIINELTKRCFPVSMSPVSVHEERQIVEKSEIVQKSVEKGIESDVRVQEMKKTRRSAVYNKDDSSSSSSDSDSDEEKEKEKKDKEKEEDEKDEKEECDEDDIIIIREVFAREVHRMLEHRKTTVKKEPAEKREQFSEAYKTNIIPPIPMKANVKPEPKGESWRYGGTSSSQAEREELVSNKVEPEASNNQSFSEPNHLPMANPWIRPPQRLSMQDNPIEQHSRGMSQWDYVEQIRRRENRALLPTPASREREHLRRRRVGSWGEEGSYSRKGGYHEESVDLRRRRIRGPGIENEKRDERSFPRKDGYHKEPEELRRRRTRVPGMVRSEKRDEGSYSRNGGHHEEPDDLRRRRIRNHDMRNEIDWLRRDEQDSLRRMRRRRERAGVVGMPMRSGKLRISYKGKGKSLKLAAPRRGVHPPLMEQESERRGKNMQEVVEENLEIVQSSMKKRKRRKQVVENPGMEQVAPEKEYVVNNRKKVVYPRNEPVEAVRKESFQVEGPPRKNKRIVFESVTEQPPKRNKHIIFEPADEKKFKNKHTKFGNVEEKPKRNTHKFF